MKAIFVGDMHVTPETLPECSALMGEINRAVISEKPDYICFLGDQHHTHGIVRVEVLEWWQQAFRMLQGVIANHGYNTKVVALVGNHDKPGGEDDGPHAMRAYDMDVIVVDRSRTFDWAPNTLFMPHRTDKERFVESCVNIPTCLLVCHQTFDGSLYDNGFYASDGVDASRIPQATVISGHIHTESTVGKVWYPGSPRWMTLGDANVSKGFWTVEIKNGVVTSKVRHDTADVCRRIESFVETPDFLRGDNITPDMVDYVVDLRGPTPWIQERLAFWNGKARVRTFPMDANAPKLKESEGVGKAFGKYLDSYKPKYGTDKATLATMAKERCGM